ncbi:hypothetical protein C8Q77DRAFT_371188 [Trametes polyzona]|nr:hypothetical protein C8Q77DRAFT_371188 [Trametes polyzona]
MSPQNPRLSRLCASALALHLPAQHFAMSISKTITIIGGALGSAPCDITLAFIPPNADFSSVIPIAWKVISLKAGDKLVYQWNNGPAAARAIVNAKTDIVTPEVFAPIAIGQISDLYLDENQHPPEYSFKKPKSTPEKRACVMNRTGGYVDIGAGYITDINTPMEDIHIPIVLRRVIDQSPGYVDFVPVLTLWASLSGFQESQLLDDSVTTIPPLWKEDLTKIDGEDITITMKRVNGKLIAVGPKPSNGPTMLSLFKQANIPNRPYTYTVELAFATPGLVVSGVTSIVNTLFPLGYHAKFTQKGYDTEGEIVLTLPEHVSCNKAELETIAAIEANPTIYGKAYIKSHSGAVLVSAHNGLESWLEVNPASPQWFGVKGQGENAAFDGANAEAFQQVNAAADGANGSADPVDVPAKTGGRRKAVNVNAGADAYDGNGTAEGDASKFGSVRRNGGRRAVLA